MTLSITDDLIDQLGKDRLDITKHHGANGFALNPNVFDRIVQLVEVIIVTMTFEISVLDMAQLMNDKPYIPLEKSLAENRIICDICQLDNTIGIHTGGWDVSPLDAYDSQR